MEFNEQGAEQSRSKAFESSLEMGALITRGLINERLKKPSEREVGETLKFISENLSPAIKEVTKIDSLKTFKKLNTEYYGYLPSAPYLSASIIENIAVALGTQAATDFKNIKPLSSIPLSSICKYDVCKGIMTVALTVLDAERHIRGTIDNELGDFLSEHLSETVSPTNQADFYLTKKAKILRYSELLKKDPTGKSLIKKAVEEIKNPNFQSSPSFKEFMVYGARFADKTYGIVYPLAEKITKPT